MGLFKKKKDSQPKEQQAVLTLYACRKNADGIIDLASEHLGDTAVMHEDTADGAVFTLVDNSKIAFHIMNTNSVPGHIAGMANFFMGAPLSNKSVKEAAIRQIMVFNCVVGVEFTVNEDDKRTDFLLVAVYLMAVKLKGFVLHPNMYLYGGDRKLLISIDGKTDYEEYTPIADSSLLDKDIPEEQADIDRRERSVARCKKMGIPYMEKLRAAVYESECAVPSKEEIIRRLACVFAAAVCSEACNYEPEKAENMCRGMLNELEEKYLVSKWFSDEEKAYTANPLGFPKLHPKFGWRYEGCAVLLWALGLWELGVPDKICSAEELGKILWNNDFDSLSEKAVLKSKTEILDMQDLIFRYDWACVDARMKGTQMTVIDGEIVYEWHYALNWLVGADGVRDWDKITVNT